MLKVNADDKVARRNILNDAEIEICLRKTTSWRLNRRTWRISGRRRTSGGRADQLNKDWIY